MPNILDQWRPIPVYDPNTLSYVMWDGSLRTGALTIGTVNQGTGGVSAWKVDGSAVTQPVSNAGTFAVQVTSMPAGGSGLTNTELRATPVPVSGTFYQATQPVSLAVAPTTPVTGTFWQATQPISAASLPSHDVTNAGTFAVQATGTVTANLAAGTNNIGDVDVVTLPALPAGTNNIGDVDVLSLPSLPTGANVIGAISNTGFTANAGTNLNTSALALDASISTLNTSVNTLLKPANTLAAVTTLGSITSALPTGANLMGKVGIDQTTPGTTNKVSLSDTAGQAQYNFPAGFQRVTDEPHYIFYDPFDAPIDAIKQWVPPTAADGGVEAVTASGSMTLGSGVTANGYSYLTSRPAFRPVVPSWLGNSWAVQIEAGATAGDNAVRFWGAGTVSGSVPSTTSPLGSTGNGYGFELDTAGVLQAVVYANGTRTVVASLASSQPTDGAFHRYICFYRTDRTFWYIDSLATPAATSNFQTPIKQTQPILALSVAGAVPPAASRVLTVSGLAVWDTGKNAAQLSDGDTPYIKATVKEAKVAASSDNPLVVTLHPLSAGLAVTTSPAITDYDFYDTTPYEAPLPEMTEFDSPWEDINPYGL